MFNQSCGCQGMHNQSGGCQNMHNQSFGCQNVPGMETGEGSINGCPRPQPLVAPKKVCITNQCTPIPQPVICPIECRRVNRCMYYPVFYPQYQQTFVTIPGNTPFGQSNEWNNSMGQSNQCM